MKLFDINADSFWDAFGRGMIILVIGWTIVIVSMVWYQSCRSAEMYNRLNGASFTCSDFFWTSDQINSQTQTIHLKQ